MGARGIVTETAATRHAATSTPPRLRVAAAEAAGPHEYRARLDAPVRSTRGAGPTHPQAVPQPLRADRFTRTGAENTDQVRDAGDDFAAPAGHLNLRPRVRFTGPAYGLLGLPRVLGAVRIHARPMRPAGEPGPDRSARTVSAVLLLTPLTYR